MARCTPSWVRLRGSCSRAAQRDSRGRPSSPSCWPPPPSPLPPLLSRLRRVGGAASRGASRGRVAMSTAGHGCAPALLRRQYCARHAAPSHLHEHAPPTHCLKVKGRAQGAPGSSPSSSGAAPTASYSWRASCSASASASLPLRTRGERGASGAPSLVDLRASSTTSQWSAAQKGLWRGHGGGGWGRTAWQEWQLRAGRRGGPAGAKLSWRHGRHGSSTRGMGQLLQAPGLHARRPPSCTGRLGLRLQELSSTHCRTTPPAGDVQSGLHVSCQHLDSFLAGGGREVGVVREEQHLQGRGGWGWVGGGGFLFQERVL